MRKTFAYIAFSALLVLGAYWQVSAQAACPSGNSCGWIGVSNVTEFGVAPSASPQNFYNDQATKDQLCRLKGYDGNYNGISTQAQWSKCNKEYHVDWRGYWDSHPCGADSYLTNVYCSKALINNVPMVSWGLIPSNVSPGASYTITANANDSDGNLSSVVIEKDGGLFASGGSSGVASGSTSDGCGESITYTAWATDGAGATSAVITHRVDVDACPTSTPPSPPTGHFEATCSKVFGLASDPDDPNQSIEVYFQAAGPGGARYWAGSTNTNAAGSHFEMDLNSVGARTLYALARDSDTGVGTEIGQVALNCPGGFGTPTAHVGVSPSIVPSSGQNVTITWASTNADFCIASGAWTGDKGKSGSETVFVSSPSTFVLQCTGPDETATSQAVVSVQPAVPAPSSRTASLSLSKACARPGENIAFSSNAGGSSVFSHVIEKDSNQDGVFGALKDFGGAAGLQSHSESFGTGVYDFRTVVNDSAYSSVQRLTVSSACGGVPVAPPVTPPAAPPAIPTGGGVGGGNNCVATVSSDGPLSLSVTGSSARLSWAFGGQCAHTWSGSLSSKSPSGSHTAALSNGTHAWPLYCWSPGNSGFAPDKQFTVSASCGSTVPSSVGGPGGGGTTGGGSGPVATPGFTLSTNVSTIRARSLAGYSGATEGDILISVNPVSGFNADVKIEVDTTSLPAGIKPTYSFAGGAYTENPSATMKLEGGFYKVGGSIYLPVSIRFGGTLEKDKAYTVRFKGTGLPGGAGSGFTANLSVTIDSRPLYPGFEEI